MVSLLMICPAILTSPVGDMAVSPLVAEDVAGNTAVGLVVSMGVSVALPVSVWGAVVQA